MNLLRGSKEPPKYRFWENTTITLTWKNDKEDQQRVLITEVPI